MVEDPWQLTTAPESSSYAMHKAEAADPPLLVSQVGSTKLTYLLAAIDDLTAWLDARAFHLPPMHSSCAEEFRRAPGADPAWLLVTTSGFEFVRPNREDLDQQPRFEPNSLL